MEKSENGLLWISRLLYRYVTLKNVYHELLTFHIMLSLTNICFFRIDQTVKNFRVKYLRIYSVDLQKNFAWKMKNLYHELGNLLLLFLFVKWFQKSCLEPWVHDGKNGMHIRKCVQKAFKIVSLHLQKMYAAKIEKCVENWI